MMKKLVLFTVIALSIFSCKRDRVRSSLLPNVSGKAGEVVMVIEKGWWDGAIGDSIKSYFSQEQSGLPQSEPVVDLVNIPSAAFTDIFKTHRNLIYTYISKSVEKPEILIKRDYEATPQLYISMKAPDENSFMNLFLENREKILASIIKMERERTIQTYKQFPERNIHNLLINHHQLSLSIPRGYVKRIDSTSFAWFSYETSLTSQGILVYYYDYTDTLLLEKEALIQKRNEILKKYIPGSVEGSYMTTEMDYPPDFKEFSLNGKYAIEIRGLWKLVNDWMGGPFISFTTIDEKRNRVVTVEGYVYAPKFDKRNYLRQVESILYTLEFPE